MREKRDLEIYHFILVYLNEHLGHGHRIGAKELSAALFISTDYLNQVCHNATKKSTSDLIGDITTDFALKYYYEDSQDLKTIAAKFGFGDVSSFCSYFKKHKGINLTSFN